MNTIYLTDITGAIGAWLDADIDDEVPYEVITLLEKAYKLAAKELER